MPARNQRLYLYASKVDQPGQVIDFPLWWDRREFFNKYGDRQVDLGNPVYVDYALLLAPSEVLEFDKECIEKFHADPRTNSQLFISAMEQLQSALKKASWVIVESYEWESGLD